MNILISPNAFKNSLSAEAAALVIRRGLMESKLECNCECFPIGDGGNGTAELIIKKCGGTFVTTEVCDPLGRKMQALMGVIDDGNTAVVELANSSGIQLLSNTELQPLKANSYGTGQQIKFALDMGVKKIILCIGGSAVIDGGTGIMRALGIRFLDSNGKNLPVLPKDLSRLHTIDLSGFDPRIENCEVTILCDVNNPLLGDEGAATIFGPQKGASINDIVVLEQCLSKLAEITYKQTGKEITLIKYGGAAGGTAAGLYAFFNAKLVNGIDYFLELTEFENSLKKCDLVITGEGSIDEQTIHGKGPYGVAYRGKLFNKPVIGVAGKVPAEESQKLNQWFDILISIGNEPTDLDTAIRNTEINLTRVARELGNLIAMGELVNQQGFMVKKF
jgi:glycerate kinase